VSAFLILYGLEMLGLVCIGVLALSLCRAAGRSDMTRELWEMFDDEDEVAS
jgi:hypothetical protein